MPKTHARQKAGVLHDFFRSWKAIHEVICMSYVNPMLRSRFESLPIDLKNEILSRDVTLNNLQDLINVLQVIVDEADAAP